MQGRQRVVNVGLLVALAGLAAAGVASVGNPARARTVVRTASVQRGDVQATVTASGNVVTPTALTLNLVTGGKVTEVDVKPGDQVTTGQTLAKVDSITQQAAVAVAQANLTAAQDKLAPIQNPLTPQQAAANDAAAQQAATAVTNAQTNLADQQRIAQSNATAYQNAVNAAQNQLQADQNQLQADQNQLQADQAASNNQAAASDQQKVNADNQAVAKDQAALTTAQTNQAQGTARDQQTVDQAQQAVTNAQNSYQATLANNALKAAPPLPGDLASAQAGVTSAQASLTTAQQALAGTTLTAPSNGTITVVNGIVGQTVSGGGSSASSTSSSSSSSGTGSGSGSSSSTGSGFMSLIDLTTLQVKAGFSETDAARVAPGQPATVTFPALPTTEVAAHVVAVDATSTLVSNVVTYTATLALDNAAQAVRPGMSANVSVVVAMANNVLHVPTSALRGNGATGTVSVMRAGKQATIPVTVGVRGDQDVEVTSGLSEGDVVVVSTGSTLGTSGTRTTTVGRGGGFGGFGGLGG